MTVHHYPMPSRFTDREMTIKERFPDFQQDLVDWLTKSVTHDGDKAQELLDQEPRLEGFYQLVRNLSQIRIGGKCRVHMQIDWGRLPDGRWSATAIYLSVDRAEREAKIATRRIEKTRALERADTEFMNRRPDLRKVAYPAENSNPKFLDSYISAGQHKLDAVFKMVWNSAKKDAALPENPFENPLEDTASALKYGIGKVIDKAPGGETFNTSKDAIVAVAEDDVFTVAKLGAEHFAKDALEEAGAPFMDFFELTLGGMCDVAIAGQAGRVAKIRSHAYVYFTYGLLDAMVYVDSPRPRSPAELKYFRGGQNVVQKLIPANTAFNVQTALIHYAAVNPTGRFQFKLDAPDFTFQDEYIRYWSPDLLGRSLLTQLCKAPYLVD
jgi:hypothetical protein